MNRRFVASFVVVTGAMTAAIQLTGQAVTTGGTAATVLAALAALIGALGFVALARIVFIVERERRQR